MSYWVILSALLCIVVSSAAVSKLHHHQAATVKNHHQSAITKQHQPTVQNHHYQPEPEQDEPLLTPLKLQYVAPKAFLNSAGLVRSPQTSTVNQHQYTQATPIPQQQHIIPQNDEPTSYLPLTVYAVPSAPENTYTGQERVDRLPQSYNIIPELQFVNPRAMPVVSGAHVSSLLNAAYHPGYLIMAMPPSSYTAVAYYNDLQNQQQVNQEQADAPQQTNQEHNYNSNVNSRSNPHATTNQEYDYHTQIDGQSNSDAIIEADSSSDFPVTADDKVLSVSYKDNHVKYNY